MNYYFKYIISFFRNFKDIRINTHNMITYDLLWRSTVDSVKKLSKEQIQNFINHKNDPEALEAYKQIIEEKHAKWEGKDKPSYFNPMLSSTEIEHIKNIIIKNKTT